MIILFVFMVALTVALLGISISGLIGVIRVQDWDFIVIPILALAMSGFACYQTYQAFLKVFITQ